MSELSENEAAGAGTLTAGGEALDIALTPHNTTENALSQDPAGSNGKGPEIDYLQVGFDHATAAMDDFERGLTDILAMDVAALNRVRSNLPKAEVHLLNQLIATELAQRAPGTREHIFPLLLDETMPPADLSELAAAVGVQPYGSNWADMQARIGPVSWAWQPWLPNGFVTIVAGEPGEGKSILCLRIAKSVLLAEPWPDGQPYEGEPGAVVWAEAEAAQALNLERAQTWGLPLEKIYTPLDDPLLDITLDSNEGMEVLTRIAGLPEVRLIIVDSLRGIHQGDENSSALMEVVKSLAELARNINKPILITHHLRKRGLLDVSDRINLERIRGSSAIIQTARCVWAIDSPDPQEESHKRLSVIKNNMARFPEPLGFTIGDEMALTFGDAPEMPKAESQLDKAIDLLRALLADGPILSKELEEEAKGAAISWHTMMRAKKTLGIVDRREQVAVKPDGKPKMGIKWALPVRKEDDLPDYLQ